MSISIALKSLNQYRKRDILAYLSLRYYLGSKSSQTDLWAHEVAIYLSLKKNSPKLLKIRHFKCFSEEKPQFRDIFIPSPNDIVAESALISKCSEYDSFQSNPSVYSYLINKDNRSIFQHYTNGLKKRHSSIQSACRYKDNEEIMYLDVKSFYPSIDLNRIRSIWIDTCSTTELPEKYIRLGLSFIEKFKIEQGNIERPGLLIGPMFSHLLANLYLKDLDESMKLITGNRYWRYVDDIILVGKKEEIDKFSDKLHVEIKSLGLEFHTESKSFRLKTTDWLKNKTPVSIELSKKWPHLIGQIKRLAIFYPERIEDLRRILEEMEVRLEILGYTREVKSNTLSSGLFRWIQRNTSFKALKPEIIASFVEEIRSHYLILLINALKQSESNELEKKSRVTEIKYLVSRLIYLSTEKNLRIIADSIKNIPELHLQYEIINTILTGDISKIIKLGTNATQAAAQVIKTKWSNLTCSLDPSDNDVIVALSIFKFHGITIDILNNEEIENSFFDFASGAIEKAQKTDDSYLHEFVALHGNKESRHIETLNTLFDENETVSFDVLNAAMGSSYYF